MAVVEPYASCPCGSGEKYKWCCQKAEAFLEKSTRLYHSNHVEAAISALDEGLRKAPGNPLLTLRKALMLIGQERFTQARDVMEALVRTHPTHPAAQSLYLRLLTETDGPQAAVGQLQQTLAGLKPEARKNPEIVGAIESVGSTLAGAEMVPAAIAHLELAQKLDPEEPVSALRSLRTNRSLSLWLRAPYRLSPVPEGIDEAKRRRFSAALEKASEGLWGPSAADFDALAREGTPEADRNLGLCRLWLGDHPGAVEALRRHTRWVGASVDSVELEALCQLIEPIRDEDRVELLQWIWPVRNHEALIQTLRADDRAVPQGRQPIDPDDPDSPEIDLFLMLDRVMPADISAASTPDLLPKLEGRVRLGQEIVAVEAFDDGRLERLAERFKRLADGSITPAHPRSKVVGLTDRPHLALRNEWLTPPGTTQKDLKRLRTEEMRRVYSEVWPETPQPYLDGRTPRQAAKDGNAELPLRAALVLIEQNGPLLASGFDVPALRAGLNLPPEPEFDPETVNLSEIPVTRLHTIDPARLTDDTLVKLFDISDQWGLSNRIFQALAQALIDRPALLDRMDGGERRVLVFAQMAAHEMAQGHREESLGWLQRGRSTDPAAVKDENAVRWDTLELRLRSQVDDPSSWVPFLATLLDRYGAEGPHGQTLLMTLLNMGLVQAQPHPDRPGEILLDTRTLQMALEQFGPKITTATGELGVSVTGGKVWTPESETTSSGGLWTPGQPGRNPPGESKSRLIIPGR